MNRQLKFRAWDKETNSWYKPDFRGYVGKIHELLITFSGELARRTMNPTLEHESLFPDRYILMQFTGLLDRNGKEIYEGDILDGSWTNPMSQEKVTRHYKVTFDKGKYNAELIGHHPYGSTMLYFENEKGEVIGNIYEHPHLLEAT